MKPLSLVFLVGASQRYRLRTWVRCQLTGQALWKKGHAGVLCATWLLLPQLSYGANHYIRAGAAGGNSGSDWNNAYTTLPGSYTRGDAYYIASGNYSGNFVFSTPESGTNYITFKKATVADHGVATGWNDSFATGQASLSTTSGILIRPQTGYWIFDGQVGTGDGTGTNLQHGIKFSTSDVNSSLAYIINGYNVHFITYKHIEVQGTGFYKGTDSNPLFENNAQSPGSSDLTWQYCYMHDCGGAWIFNHQNCPNVLVERCYFKNAGSGNASLHMVGLGFYGTQANMNVVVRYNVLENVGNIGGTGYILCGQDAPPNLTSSGYDIYGNVFLSTSTSEGPGLYVVGCASADNVSGVRIYNNTIYGLRNGSSMWFGHGDSTIVASNNVWQGCVNNPTFNNCVEGSNIKNTGGVTFADPANRNFHLTSHTSPAGVILSSAYGADLDGVGRALNGSWDIGAFAYNGGGVQSTNLPPVVSAIIQNATDVDPSVPGLQVLEGTSVQFSGTASDPNGDPLSWQWIYSINGGAEVVYRSGTGAVAAAPFTYGTGTGGNTYIWKLRASDGQITAETTLTVGVKVPTPVDGGLSVEAEAGVVASPFIITNGFIYQSIDSQANMASGGRASYSFTITNSGSYVIEAVVDAPTLAGNSFFINMDAEPVDPSMIWDIPVTTGFEKRIVAWRGNGTFDNDQFVPKWFNLAQGVHQLIILGREPDTKLDRISLVKLPPQVTGLSIVAQ